MLKKIQIPSASLKADGNLLLENLWLSSKEAADYLRTSDQQIRNWVYQGKIKSYKLLGKKLLFKKSDLDAAILPQGGW